MKVQLRERKQGANGKISLYLEIYKGSYVTPEGKRQILREYEYLNLYLIEKPKTNLEKDQNKEVRRVAEVKRAAMELELLNNRHGVPSLKIQHGNFVDFYRSLVNQRHDSKGNFGNWESSYKHFVKFNGPVLKFRDLDSQLCERFKKYLQLEAVKSSGELLSSSSVSSYFSKFRAVINEAVEKNLISRNPATSVSTPRVIEKERVYLTYEELKRAFVSECRYPVLKRAYLFACLTGLRWSDVNNLKWSEVQEFEGIWRITFHQQKTKGLQYLDISNQARELMGDAQLGTDKVFVGLKYSSYMNVELSKWMLRSGITKDVTFHSSRHTYAVLQLNYGTELETLQKLLGHSIIRTTQVYAQILDSKKRESINRIPRIEI